MARLDSDRRNRRPVTNALLNWQLQQDRRRLTGVQERLMRVRAPSSSPQNNQFEPQNQEIRPSPVRKAFRMHHNDPEEDALMDLIMEREHREAATSNQREQKTSRLPFPSVLPPLRRPKAPQNLPPRPPHSGAQKVKLRPTGQKLNAAGDLYSPVRPQGSMNDSGFSTRASLSISRIKAPSTGVYASPQPKTPMRYDQMTTPDRWRKTAMKSNQDEVDADAMRRWEEEDAAQADRLLEKAARDGDNEGLWNDLFYGTKAARAKKNQQNPLETVVYSTSSFQEEFSQPLNDSYGGACYEDEKNGFIYPHKTEVGDGDMFASDLCTLSTSEHTKPPTSQLSDAELLVTNSSVVSPKKTVSEMLNSLTQGSGAAESNGDVVSGGDEGYDGSNGGDKEQFSGGIPVVDHQFVLRLASSEIVFPQWSVIVVACLLVIGTSGFFVEELIWLFSRNASYTLSKGEQERMRKRVNALHQELQGFQLSTSEIELRSQNVLKELQTYMEKLRRSREKHQDMISNEMQDLRRYIVRTTHELVEKERRMIHAQLKETIAIQVIGDEGEKSGQVITDTTENDKETKAHTPQLDVVSEPLPPHFFKEVSVSPEPSVDGQSSGEQVHAVDQYHVEPSAQSSIAEEDSVIQPSSEVDIDPVQTKLLSYEENHIEVKEPSQSVMEEKAIEPEQTVKDTVVERYDDVVPVVQAGNDKVGAANEVMTAPTSETITISTPPQTTAMSWEAMLLLIAAVCLGACVVLRVWNFYRRKRWFEHRRKRRQKQAFLLAQQRARMMAKYQDDIDEWEDTDTDSNVETVSLMTPTSDDDSRPPIISSANDADAGNDHDGGFDFHREPTMRSPGPKAAVYRPVSSERSSRTRTGRRLGSPQLLHRRSPQLERTRRQYRVSEY